MEWNPNIPVVTNNVQDDLDAIRANFQHLDQSRIVEMGENANGHYVRWENGLQACWFTNNPTPNFTERIEGAVSGYLHWDDWTYPATFIAIPSVVAIGRGAVDFVIQTSLNTSIVSVSTTTAGIRLWAWNQVNVNVTICRIAIGRWK